MKNKDVKLYNVLFPFWMILLFPSMWLIILPGNFIIDSLVLVISMYALKLSFKKEFYKKHILKIFSFGILSDVLGALYMLVLVLFFQVGQMGDEIYLTLPALFISAFFIFIFNYFITFKKCDKSLRLKLSLVFVTVTSPYTFLIPSSWLY